MAFCHLQNYIPKIIVWPNIYLQVYNRFYKNKSLLEKPSTQGAIKKIIFPSSISLYSYLKTLGWEPVFDKMFSEENPSRSERSARKCFIKPELLGAIGEITKNPSCWEQSESLRKPELLGAVGDGGLFTKSLLSPEQLTCATTLPEMGRA